MNRSDRILMIRAVDCFLTLSLLLVASSFGSREKNKIEVTNGPILGRLSHNGIGVWVRTSQPVKFRVSCKAKSSGEENSAIGETYLEHDNTGWTHITGLIPNTEYAYEIEIPDSEYRIEGGTFITLPHADQFRDPEYNPRGLFNFRFEFGCGNSQNPQASIGPSLPAFKTMFEHLRGKIHFQMMNGDWLYEELRETPVEKWLTDNKLDRADIPRVVQIAPSIVGVWENYKLYLSRGKNLIRWHRNIPAFFTFDDHEILNDVYGAGSPGLRNRRATFRDIGVQAWRDYLGWSNPPLDTNPQDILFGQATLSAGRNILFDSFADFTKLDLERAATLHVHWGGPTAGVHDVTLDVVGGHPDAGVYKIEKVLDRHRLKIFPAAKADGENVSYSIGMINYYRLRVSNCDFFVLDTRSHREIHDIKNPWKKNLSMIGERQKKWLIEGMRQSNADFFFVVSSVNFTVPHAGGWKIDASNKDDAWTVFLDEREQLINFWDELSKPVFVLTGDLHNSFAIKITDNIWEFASGPHNSQNHWNTDEGNRPASGDFEYNGRKVNIRWSTFWLNDIPRKNLRYPYYCVVQINNVFNNPRHPGEQRWIAYPKPQVIFQYYNGLTGELEYAEAITTRICPQ